MKQLILHTMHFILHYDKQHYVYMRDVDNDHVLFAVPKDQHDIFSDTVLIYNCEPNEVPDDYTLEVLPMTEVSDDVYDLKEIKPMRFPINHLNYVFAFPVESAGMN